MRLVRVRKTERECRRRGTLSDVLKVFIAADNTEFEEKRGDPITACCMFLGTTGIVMDSHMIWQNCFVVVSILFLEIR